MAHEFVIGVLLDCQYPGIPKYRAIDLCCPEPKECSSYKPSLKGRVHREARGDWTTNSGNEGVFRNKNHGSEN